MDFQFLQDKGPHPLLWADSQAPCRKIIEMGIINSVNYCAMFIVCTWFIIVAAAPVRQLGRQGFEAHGVDMWKEFLGKRHSLLSHVFLFLFTNQHLYIVKNMYVRTNICLRRDCIWITVATKEHCEWNSVTQSGSGAKCWLGIYH